MEGGFGSRCSGKSGPCDPQRGKLRAVHVSRVPSGGQASSSHAPAPSGGNRVMGTLGSSRIRKGFAASQYETLPSQITEEPPKAPQVSCDSRQQVTSSSGTIGCSHQPWTPQSLAACGRKGTGWILCPLPGQDAQSQCINLPSSRTLVTPETGTLAWVQAGLGITCPSFTRLGCWELEGTFVITAQSEGETCPSHTCGGATCKIKVPQVRDRSSPHHHHVD